MGTTIWWAGGYVVGYGGPGDNTITHHEFAHVIRQSLDGDFAHFLGDVASYNYLQNHEPCLHSNSGYAFNEGWAEYWAGDFLPAPDCGRPMDMETEGDVAVALRELAHECAGDQRKLMVENLQRNPGRIHSFAEFKSALGCPVPLLVAAPPTLPVPKLPPKPVAVPISDAARAAIARDEATAIGKELLGSRRQLKVALRQVADVPPCIKPPCSAALRTLTLPPALRFEISLDKIRLHTLGEFDTKREQHKLSLEPLAKLDKSAASLEARDRRKIVQAALTGVEQALAAAQPVLKVDHSKLAENFRHEMTKALGRFRRAARHHAKRLPVSLTLTTAEFKLPRRVHVIPTPAPKPTPGPAPDQRADSRR